MNKDIYPPFRNPVGRPLKYPPEKLAEKFAEYIEWAKDHPIEVDKVVQGPNGVTTATEQKPRLLSTSGFCVWLGVTEEWWRGLSSGKRGEEFSSLKKNIQGYCDEYQKEMASAFIFHANIISRLLGLAEKQAVQAEGVKIVVESKEQADKIENIGELDV